MISLPCLNHSRWSAMLTTMYGWFVASAAVSLSSALRLSPVMPSLALTSLSTPRLSL